MGLFSKKKTKAMVVGLDGVPHSLLVKLMDQGVLVNIAQIVKGGNLRQMEVTVPEISSVSWPSFMTGTDPGTHGIFGFTEVVPGTYDLTFPGFGDLKAPTIWDTLEKSGKRSVVLNQPGTYPARRTGGVLVSGFVAIELHKSVYPAKYIGKLRRINYEIDIDTSRARKDHVFAFRDLERTLDLRKQAAQMFLDLEEWDFFELVVTGTDRLHHYLWHALADPDHEHHARAIAYYREVDELVGQMARAYREATHDDAMSGFFMLSDHGFCALEHEVALTTFLREKGLMAFETDEPTELGQIDGSSKVLVLDPNRIYVHRKDRFPKGCVDPADAPIVVQDVQDALSELEHDGKKLVRRFFTQEEAYHGPQTDRGPDLVAVSVDGYDFKGSVDRKQVFGKFDLSGMHNQYDAFLWTAKKPADNPNITQVAPMILDHLK